MTTTDHKPNAPDAVLSALGANRQATTAELAAATGLGRSTVGKALVALESSGKVARTPGGREGGRREPDRWALAEAFKPARRQSRPTATTGTADRLGRGQLREMVLAELRSQEEAASPSKVAAALGHSSGAIGNALERLVEAGSAERTNNRPRRYRATPASDPEAATA